MVEQRSQETSGAPDDPKRITVTRKTCNGGLSTKFEGTCGPEVTVADITARFYDPYFGGRSAWVDRGHWGAVRHDD